MANSADLNLAPKICQKAESACDSDLWVRLMTQNFDSDLWLRLFESDFVTQTDDSEFIFSLSRIRATPVKVALESKTQWNFPWKFPLRNQYINESSDKNQSFWKMIRYREVDFIYSLSETLLKSSRTKSVRLTFNMKSYSGVVYSLCFIVIVTCLADFS